jgi:hypothetical protein
MVLNILTPEKRTAVERCLEVEMVPSTELSGHWNCTVRVVDPDPQRQLPPYILPNALPADLERELETWSRLHGDGFVALPVYFSKAEPQVIAKFTYQLRGEHDARR